MSVYLSRENPRWVPVSESDLRLAADGGLLEETHWLELKGEITSSKSAHKELARDLASLANDGGTLLIGVDEPESAGDPLILDPVSLEGLPERIESVARTIPDPPLPVTCHAIPSDADPALGFVVVQVPMSGEAPHMVDGVYHGRGDKRRIRLTDAAVRRLHAGQAASRDRILEILVEAVRRDPVPVGVARGAHLLVVAEPVSPPREMALELVHGARWYEPFREVVQAGSPKDNAVLRENQVLADFHTNNVGKRPDGAAMFYGLRDDRTPEMDVNGAPREDYFEIQITEEGGVRVTYGALGGELRGEKYIVDLVIPLFVRRVVHVAAAISDRFGYLGSWGIAFAATGLQGVRASPTQGWRAPTPLPIYEDAEFRRATVATLAEMTQTPGALTSRLTGQLLRGLGVFDSYAVLLTD